MINTAITLILLLLGLLNAYPVVGVFSAERLHALYGVSVQDPNLLILLRYRAVLIGMLGGLVITSAFMPGLRTTAILLLLTSALSFVALAYLQGGFNPAIRKVVMIDIVQSVILLAILIRHWMGASA